ncbi:MAG: bacillithiol biosynthesis deacetylase BshB1 [Bacteroidetes bacterium]|nr:bacillithiol biosynthesis deacetylase BshB1 [Bacteroidota bacterium]
MERVDILAIGVHPDDVELACSGTILKHIALGKKVGILDLTLGELGTRGDKNVRTQEAKASAKILGVTFRHQLNMSDGFFENNKEHQIEIIKILRNCCPQIVLCNAINDRHPDHGRAAKLVADACFYSGLNKIETYFNNQLQNSWRPKAVYHYIQDYFIEPDLVIDVSNFIEKKREAIMAFSSQFYNPKSNEPETPISSKDFIESVFAKMNIWGRSIGVAYAEGYTSARYIGAANLFDLL